MKIIFTLFILCITINIFSTPTVTASGVYLGWALTEKEKELALKSELVPLPELVLNPKNHSGKQIIFLGTKPTSTSNDPVTFTPEYDSNREQHLGYLLKSQNVETFVPEKYSAVVDLYKLKDFYTKLGNKNSFVVIGKYMGTIKVNDVKYPLIKPEHVRFISPDDRSAEKMVKYINGQPQPSEKLREERLEKELDDAMAVFEDLLATSAPAGSRDDAYKQQRSNEYKKIIAEVIMTDSSPLESEFESSKKQQASGKTYNETGILPTIPDFDIEKGQQTADQKKQPVDSGQKIQASTIVNKTLDTKPTAPASTTGYSGVDEIERMILDKVNYERTSRGLAPLFYNSLLTQSARQHSKEMCDLNYFSHYSPVAEYKDVSDRIKKTGATFSYVGENISMMPRGNVTGYGVVESDDQASSAIHTSWMNSPGHRENILRPEYNAIGIGVFFSNGQWMSTQNFAKIDVFLNEIKTIPGTASDKVKLTVSGKLVRSGGKIGLWSNNTFLGDAPMQSNGKFSFATEINKNGQLYSIDIGVSSSSGGSYSMTDKFFVNTAKPFDTMITTAN
ncbi:MAG: CAP domain-containing protein [Elusimicrobiota bacterium]